MTHAFEQLNEFTREYEIPIEQDQFDERLQNLTKDVATKAHLKGFRKGKTPRGLIKQRYGAALQNDVIQDIVQDNYSTLLNEAELKASWIGRPYVADFDEDRPSRVKLRVETVPEFDAEILDALTVKRPMVQFTDEAIEAEIDTARERCIDWYELKGDGIVAHAGDRVWFTYGADDEETTASHDETTDEQAVDGEREIEPPQLMVVLRNPKNEMAAALHNKILGNGVHATFDIEESEVAAAGAQLDSDSTSLTARITKIEQGDLPPLSERLYEDASFRYLLAKYEGTPPQSLAELKKAVIPSLEALVTDYTQAHIEQRVLMELASRYVPAIPRETVRQEYANLLRLSEQQTDQAYAYMRLFDAIVDDEPLTTELWTKRPAFEEIPVKINPPAGESFEPLPEMLVSQVREHARNAVQNVAVGLTMRALVDHLELEADQEAIAQAIQSQVRLYESFMTQSDRMQEMMDYLYSEEHYQQQVSSNLEEQARKQLVERATYEDEEVALADVINGTNELPMNSLTTFTVLPGYPVPKVLQPNDDSPTAASSGDAEDGASKDSNEDPIVDETIAAEPEQKSSFISRLFRKNKDS
ncbi:MAG: hypothetical protein F4W90_07720 [Gammaproteobacteria bacterium]|nr:hypothetical protein [Gammaproteobacteria bacterium]